MSAENTPEFRKLYFHQKRHHLEKKSVDLYRCFDASQNVLFSVHADRFGKPAFILESSGDEQIGEIRNRKNYLINGKTDIYDLRGQTLLGSYSRLSQVYDAADTKIGRWWDARSWSDEFKANLVDAIANTLLGSGDVPGGANLSDTHLLSRGKVILAKLEREKLPFFPDPPKKSSPGKMAKFASKIVPGELGKSLGEITPPVGWTLTLQNHPGGEDNTRLLPYAAFVRIQYLRWASH